MGVIRKQGFQAVVLSTCPGPFRGQHILQTETDSSKSGEQITDISEAQGQDGNICHCMMDFQTSRSSPLSRSPDGEF